MQVLTTASRAVGEETEEDSENSRESRTPAISPSPTTGDMAGAVMEGRHPLVSLNGSMSSGEGKSPAKMWNKLNTEMKNNMDKIRQSEFKPSILIHGLTHFRHFPCDSPVQHMTYGEGAAGFISLHRGGTVCMYSPNGCLRNPPTSPITIPYKGLTSTHVPGNLVGWGPGAILTLLDCDLQPLLEAVDPLDVSVCQVTEQSLELVTAGMGNVCVWGLTHMVCRVRVVEGLGRHTAFSQLALAAPGPDTNHRAFVVYSKSVVVVDLTAGRVLEHKRNLHKRDITALVYCRLLDLVVMASKDISIRVWDANWELLMVFVGHTDVVTSMIWWPQCGLLLSASLDKTLCCWSLEEGDQVQSVSIQGNSPPLALGGPSTGDTFYTFSQKGVDFWGLSTLYTPYCRLGGEANGPVRQIKVTSFPQPYPTRVLCVSGDRDVTLVAGQTGTVLTTFRAARRVRWADYCLPKEILLVLTEAGTVIYASTLTNPATQLEEWEGRGQGPWHRDEQADGEGGQGQAGPGPASCLVLYHCVADDQRVLGEWMSLQEKRGQKPPNRKHHLDPKNKFLVMQGHSGGCVSVLMLESGQMQYRTAAHNGQKITCIQADPENSSVVTTGEDKAVLVWRVFPYAQDCLCLHLNLFCIQYPLHLALLGPLLALAFELPHSATYSLVQFNLPNKTRLDHPPSDDHDHCFTGLCVSRQLRVFASSSRDGTIRIWDEENRLIRTLQMNAEAECLAFCEERGDLLLGIRGHLYRIPCTKLLPNNLQLRLLCTECTDPIPDVPISRTLSKANKSKTEHPDIPEKRKKDQTRDPEYEALLARNADLASLQQGAIQRRKTKYRPTNRTRKEAFERYIKIIYNQPVNIKIGKEDMFDLQAILFPPKPPVCQPFTSPSIKEGFFPGPRLATPLDKDVPKELGAEPAPAQTNATGFIPNSVLAGKLWPHVVVEEVIPCTPYKMREDLVRQSDEELEFPVDDYDLDIDSPVRLVETPPKVESPPPVRKVSHTPMERDQTPVSCPPLPPPKPSPAPLPPPRKVPTPPPPLPPSPPQPIPQFIHPFLQEDWFKGIYPDHKCVPPSLGPDDFAIQMLDYMQKCKGPTKMRIVKAMVILHRQCALSNLDRLIKGLMGYLRKVTSAKMSGDEQQVISEILHALVCLGPESRDVITKILALLANKELGLQNPVQRLLKVMGVEDTGRWLKPEMEGLNAMLPVQPHPAEALRDMVADWLDIWTTKWKENKAPFLTSAETALPVRHVDVLNFFGWVEKEKRKAPPPLNGNKDTVLIPPHCSCQAIHRLGDTHSMARSRRTTDVILPPLCQRPLLLGFPSCLTLALPRISLLPFPVDQHCLKASPRRYFVPEQSLVHYYR